MTNKFIYNDALDDIAIEQMAQLEEAEGKSYGSPTYNRIKLDQRTLEVVIDSLEAGMEAYGTDGDLDAINRIASVINFLRAD